MNIIGNGKEEFSLAKYNTGMLGFLCQQMEKVELARRYLHELGGEEVGQWWDFLKATLEQGVGLMRRHRHFDLCNFNKIKETRGQVEKSCQDLETCMNGLKLGNVISIETSIDEVIIEDDRTKLRWHAICFVENGNGDVQLDQATAAELNNMKKEHDNSLKHVHFIQEQDIEWGNIIGKGPYGEVREGRCGEHRVAVKKFNHHLGFLSVDAKAEFFAEVEIQTGMSHSNVVVTHAASKSDQSAFIVMELARTSLRKLYQQEKLTLIQKITLLAQVAHGLTYLHSRGIIHRDVKSDNVLLFGDFPSDFVVKVSDFGLASIKSRAKVVTLQQLETPWWAAPEVHKGRPHSRKSDVFSFGIMMHEVIAQRLPYGQGVSQHSLLARKRKAVSPCVIPEDCPEMLVKLMKSCIIPDPTKRPEMSDVGRCLQELFGQVSVVTLLHNNLFRHTNYRIDKTMRVRRSLSGQSMECA